LIISMEDGERLSLRQIRAVLEANGGLGFQAQDRQEMYGWIDRTLRQQDYGRLNRTGKGLVRSYVAKMTGLSRSQTTRLIQSYQQGREVKPRAYRRHRFAQRYTAADIELLVEVDTAHQTLSGPATQKILQRAYYDFSDNRFVQLAQLSVAQLYRLRQSRAYRAKRAKRVAYQHTRPTQVAIGERRKPVPENRPGYVRLDTVH
jgi:transposase